eukprot:3363155-Amphidinium_carterae.1
MLYLGRTAVQAAEAEQVRRTQPKNESIKAGSNKMSKTLCIHTHTPINDHLLDASSKASEGNVAQEACKR